MDWFYGDNMHLISKIDAHVWAWPGSVGVQYVPAVSGNTDHVENQLEVGGKSK